MWENCTSFCLLNDLCSTCFPPTSYSAYSYWMFNVIGPTPTVPCNISIPLCLYVLRVLLLSHLCKLYQALDKYTATQSVTHVSSSFPISHNASHHNTCCFCSFFIYSLFISLLGLDLQWWSSILLGSGSALPHLLTSQESYCTVFLHIVCSNPTGLLPNTFTPSTIFSTLPSVSFMLCPNHSNLLVYTLNFIKLHLLATSPLDAMTMNCFL